MKRIKSFVSFILLINSLFLYGQNLTVSGFVCDSANLPLTGATVQLKGIKGKSKYATVTDDKGTFRFTGVKGNSGYKVLISFMGFKAYENEFQLVNSGINLQKIVLIEEVKMIGEIEISVKMARAVQKGDTVQLNADAFKVNPDASAEDLVKKMPGLTVESGQVKAQGENVQNVYVDGKPFFDQDPTLTLRNLPAEVVEKIQVFDEQSEQSRFTGFNDGQTSKTINIITRGNMRNGQFGKIYAGYGSPDKYYSGGNINIFKGESRWSVIGLSNNINQQNFSSQDLVGVLNANQGRSGGGFRGGSRGGGGNNFRGGGGGRGEMNNFMVGQQPGIASTHAIGVNYSDKWGKKVNVSGSYFFNMSDNVTNDTSTQNYFTTDESSRVYAEANLSETRNINHRFNFRFDYNIDSFNSLMIRPRLSVQQNNSASSLFGKSFENNNEVSQARNRNNSERVGINFSGEMLFMHKFRKTGRTISLNITSGVNNRGSNSFLLKEDILDMNSVWRYDSTDQRTEALTEGYTLSSRISYTEPLGKKSQLQLNYNTSYSWSNSDRETNRYNPDMRQYTILDSVLSNKFRNLVTNYQVGPGYRYRTEKVSFNAGVNYEYAVIDNKQVFPENLYRNHNFTSILPNAMFTYNISKSKNLRIFYRTNTNTPSINQLQNVVDNSNSLQKSAGNPDLKQAFRQNFSFRYSSTNAEKASMFFVSAGFSLSENYIANRTIFIQGDTIIFGDTIRSGSQFTQPVNINGYRNFFLFTNFGFPLTIIKSNLNINSSYAYTRTPGIIDNEKNFSENNAFSLGIVISSNFSEKIDFTLSSNSSYNLTGSSSHADQNNNYFGQFTDLSLNLILWKGFTFQSNVSHQYYNGLSQGYDTRYLLWNLSIGKKMMKDQRGELKLSVFDVLGQNSNIRRNVTELYIEDYRSNVLQRYAIFTFTYNLRNFKLSDQKTN